MDEPDTRIGRRARLAHEGLALEAHSAYYHVIDSRTQPQGCVL